MTSRRVGVLSVAVLLLVMALELIGMTRASSASWDEPHHLFDGYTILTGWDYRLNPEVPPLIKVVAALPLLGRTWRVPASQGRSMPNDAFRMGRAFVFGNGVDRTLAPARMACMAFALGLGLLIYLAGAEMFGWAAGIFALAMFVFDPNFLAHGALVTTDVGSACGFLAAVYAFYRYRCRPTWPRLLLAGLASGLLLAAKFTGIFLFPIIGIIILLDWTRVRDPKSFRRGLAALAFVGLVAWVTLWAFYGFRYKAAPEGRALKPPLAQYLDRMYDRGDARLLGAAAHVRLLPEAYIWGLENTKQTEFEDTSYFWGRVSRHGHWEYFPMAFLIKSTLPFLLLLALAAFVWRRGSSRDGREFIFLLTPVVVYFAVAMHSDFDIGARHLLPVYPFLYVLVGGAAAALLVRDRRWAVVLAALLGWQAVTSLRVAPAYMAYGNEAWGGPAAVHRYLSDANVDWGQQLLAVRSYLAARRITDCWFAYFPDGAIEPVDYGIPCRRLPTTDSLWWLDLPMQVPPVISGTVLISDSDLEGIEFGDGPLNPYDSFRALRPDASIQNGVNVYRGHFAVPLASALVLAHDADKRLSAGHAAESLAEAERAAQLAPKSVPVLTTFGDALAANGRGGEALVAYRGALHLAQTVRPDLQASSAASLATKITKLPVR